jgi:hypothetical protein
MARPREETMSERSASGKRFDLRLWKTPATGPCGITAEINRAGKPTGVC